MLTTISILTEGGTEREISVALREGFTAEGTKAVRNTLMQNAAKLVDTNPSAPELGKPIARYTTGDHTMLSVLFAMEYGTYFDTPESKAKNGVEPSRPYARTEKIVNM